MYVWGVHHDAYMIIYGSKPYVHVHVHVNFTVVFSVCWDSVKLGKEYVLVWTCVISDAVSWNLWF